MELVGTFLGKKLYRYDPIMDCTEIDFQKFASQFSRVETLREICSISRKLFHSNEVFLYIDNVPANPDILCDFAYRVIKYCNEASTQIMTENQMGHALKMCHKLFDVDFVESENKDATAILTKISYRQFVFQQKNFNNFARNYYIYNNLWSRVPRARSIDILTEIEDEIGIPYNWAILFAYALAGNKYGHFWIYDEKAIKEINEKTGLSLTVESHAKFVKWCSGTFKDILSQNSVLPPFVRYPLVETNLKPVAN